MNHIIKQKTTSSELIQIATLKFKPSLQQGTELPLSFRDVCRQLQAVPGVSSTYFGQQIERPGTWTWIIRWASLAAHDAFLASPSFTNWIASFRAVVETYIFWKALVRGSLSATLNAPCTEVFTAYGTSDTWLEMRMKPFADNVDAANLPGHHGSFYGQYDVLMHDSHDVPEGTTVSMMLGWDSKEAHLAERGEGKVIDKNIHYTREERRSVDMPHAPSMTILEDTSIGDRDSRVKTSSPYTTNPAERMAVQLYNSFQ
ncbi:AMB domain protein [Metarhizium robertsii]|uniref:AMB domain protein n=1 Tax=Metarhizium robertsii TaxID=568076 RepID=A0A0A1UXA4_9HYPO|nr:AMB domain protein [Metarhizium robertsii]